MYRYETHLHTSIASACSRFEPREIVEKYSRLGYAGVFVTDHFLNGNTTVPDFLPWRERVAAFCDGYREVKKAAGALLDVFFGLEYSYCGTDFLVYGFGEEWLAEHPEIMEMSVPEFCNFARSNGAIVVQAHPYRTDYVEHIRLYPSFVDGFETINACRDKRINMLADVFAEAYGLKKFAGSDIHGKDLKTLAGLEFSKKLKSEADFIAQVKSGEGSVFTITDSTEK